MKKIKKSLSIPSKKQLLLSTMVVLFLSSVQASDTTTQSATVFDPSSDAVYDVALDAQLKKSWLLSGLDRTSGANASAISNITKDNLDKLKLKWVYTIPSVPLGTALNPLDNPRGENSTAQGVAVDNHGIIYVSTNDGRIFKIDSRKTSGANADGTLIPKLLDTYDLFSDPTYAGNGFDGFISRLHTSIVGNAIYAGNHKYFSATTAASVPPFAPVFADKGTGTPSPSNPNYVTQGAVLYKINRHNGKLMWKTVVDDNKQSMISLVGVTPIRVSPGNDLIIIGFSSSLSGTLGLYASKNVPDPFAGTCCNSRGGIAAVRESDGKIVWKAYTMPTPTAEQNAPNSLAIANVHGSVDGWYGGSIWSGGNFAVSYKHKLVYAGTGQAYSSYDAASECERTRSPLEDKNKCLKVLRDGSLSGATFADTTVEQTQPLVRSPLLPLPSGIVAYDYETGAIKWARPLEGFDTWNAACFPVVPFSANLSPFCPLYLRSNLGIQFTQKDRDAANPILVENVVVQGIKRDIILGMTKGSSLGAFDAATGEVLWNRPNAFGPGGLNGDGFIFGKTTDGKRFYANTGTSSALTLAQYQDPTNPAKVVPGSCDTSSGPTAGFNPTTGVWGGGMYVAVNLEDGSTAWQRCAIAKAVDPITRLPNGITNPARSSSAVSYANGIVYMPGASSRIPASSVLNENIVAEFLLLDADTGALLKTLPMGLVGEPESSAPNYQRPALVGDRLYLGGGTKRYNGKPNPTDIYNRVLMYQLENGNEQNDEYSK
jgi:hypothetical protein